MTTYLQIFEDDDVTPATEIPVALLAGDESASVFYHIWNDIGGLFGDTETVPGLKLRAEAKVGTQWLAQDVAILDEKWIRIRATGQAGSSEPFITGFLPVGSDGLFELGDIPKDSARYVELKILAPGSAQTVAESIRIVPVYDEANLPLGRQVSALVGSGTLLGRLDGARRRLRRGGEIIADGTANVTLQVREWDFDGVTRTRLDEVQTLDQNDGSAAALAGGESYIVVVSQPQTGAATWTKGNKAAAPVAPATPADEIFLGTVTVHHQAGGTSVIQQVDVDQGDVLRSEYLVEAGAGVSVRVNPGTGISATDLYQFRNAATSLNVVASDTNFIWRLADGSFTSTLTDALPEPGAELLAEADTDADSVTAIRDRRTLVSRALTTREIELDLVRGPITFLGDDLAWATVPSGDWDIESVELELGSLGDGTGAQIQIDVTTRPAGTGLGTAGTTIYTSQATDDRRPAIAFNATSLRVSTRDHEVRRVSGGQRIAADLTELITGAATDPRDLRAVVVLRRA